MKHRALLALALPALIGGCPDDPVPSEDGSSTGEPTAGSTGTPPGSTGDDGSSGAVDSTGDATQGDSTGGTTGGETASGRARFVVRERVVPGENFYDLVLFDYDSGELSTPLSLTPELPEGGGVTQNVFDGAGTNVAYCVHDPAETGTPCLAIDLTTDPPSAPQAFVSGPVPENSLVTVPDWVEDAELFVFRAIDPLGMEPDGIYAAAFRGGELQTPQAVMVAGPGEGLSDFRVRADGAWAGYAAVVEAGPRNAFIAPAAAPDPGAAMMVSDLVAPELVASIPRFIPGLDALVYSVDEAGPGATDDSLWFVDFSGPMPTAPMRVDDPLMDALEVRGPRVAPDGHALFYWVGEPGIVGDLMLVDLTTGSPQLPVLLSTRGAGEALVTNFEWSPDSRWIAYEAEHDQPETFDLYLVDVSGAVPSPPVLATGGLFPDGSIQALRFEDSSSWVYYVAPQEDMFPQMYRVDISGAEPGPPQRVSGDTGFLTGEIIFTRDWSMVMYTADDEDGRQLYVVDVSGEEPGEAIVVNEPLLGGADVQFGARFSFDGSVVIYAEQARAPDAPTTVHLVDLTDLSVRMVSEDAQGVFPIAD